MIDKIYYVLMHSGQHVNEPCCLLHVERWSHDQWCGNMNEPDDVLDIESMWWLCDAVTLNGLRVGWKCMIHGTKLHFNIQWVGLFFNYNHKPCSYWEGYHCVICYTQYSLARTPWFCLISIFLQHLGLVQWHNWNFATWVDIIKTLIIYKNKKNKKIKYIYIYIYKYSCTKI